jgi:hypothetical protein
VDGLLVVRWWLLHYEPLGSNLSILNKKNPSKDRFQCQVFEPCYLLLELSLRLVCGRDPCAALPLAWLTNPRLHSDSMQTFRSPFLTGSDKRDTNLRRRVPTGSSQHKLTIGFASQLIPVTGLELAPKRFRVSTEFDVLVDWSTLSHCYSLHR